MDAWGEAQQREWNLRSFQRQEVEPTVFAAWQVRVAERWAAERPTRKRRSAREVAADDLGR